MTDGWDDTNAAHVNIILHNDQEAYKAILDAIERSQPKGEKIAAMVTIKREAKRLREDIPSRIDLRCVKWTELVEFWLEKFKEVRGQKESGPSEEDGIKAIIALQGMMNIEETEEQARRGWQSMSASEKERTLETYRLVFQDS